MKKVLKWLGIIMISLILISLAAIWILSEPLPEGIPGPEAEALAQKIEEATRQKAWDSTTYIRWNFDDRHQLLWDQKRKLVQVEWPSFKVLLNTDDQKGMAWQDGHLLDEKKAQKKVQKAWALFCNDSFWLNAPGKLHDPGTVRKLVTLEDGTKGLLVTYQSGGVTPGDSYLWITDEQGLPVKWKMWVSMLPIGGIEAIWKDWERLPTGAQVATIREVGSYAIHITDILAGNSFENINLTSDPFAPLFKIKE